MSRSPEKKGENRSNYRALHLRDLLTLAEQVEDLGFLRNKCENLSKTFNLKEFLTCYHLALVTLKDLYEKEAAENSKLKVRLEEFTVPSKALQPFAAEDDRQIFEKKLNEQQEVVERLELKCGRLESECDRIEEEFDKLRKRSEKKVEEKAEEIRQKMILKILPILDNLERALNFKDFGDASSIFQGVEMIKRQIEEIFSREGVKEIPTNGSAFDPSLHEAAETVIREDVPENTVIEEIRKGYKLGEKVIRPALVKVARASLAN
jgi:molecular chaperone GrpE